MPKIDQLDLIIAIHKHLKKQKVKTMNVHQTNALISAANIIVDALEKEHQPAVPDMGYRAWAACDDVGISSSFMARCLLGYVAAGEYGHPHDPSDFHRCVKMIKAMPNLRGTIPEMASESPEWAKVVENWDRWEKMLEVATFGTGGATDLFKEMQENGL